MKIKQILSLVMALGISMGTAFAQGGSNYSVVGIGDLDFGGKAAYQSMGGTSIAMPMANSINMANPALWSKNIQTRLLTGYNFNQHFNQIGDYSLYQNNGQLNGVIALFQVDTSLGLSFTFGINPYSKVNYFISDKIKVNNNGAELTGLTEYKGSGGLNKGFFGAAFKLMNNLSLGAELFSTFGTIKQEIKTNIDDYYAYTYNRKSSFDISGMGYKFGVLYSPIENLNIGFYLEQQPEVDIDKVTKYDNPVSKDSIETSTITSVLPNSIGFGASYLTGKFLLGADFTMIQAKDMKLQMTTNTEFVDGMRFSVGMARIGNPNRSADFEDKITYKLGAFFQNEYYKINGEQISEMGFSFGASFPLSISSIIDAGFVLGKRGTSNSGLIEEYFGRMYVDISIGENWFKPFKVNY